MNALLKTNDEIIDRVLKILFESHTEEYPFEGLPIENKDILYDGSLIQKICNILYTEKLVEESGTRYGYSIGLKITPYGTTFMEKYGGWLDYKKNLLENQIQQQYKEQLEAEKTKLEAEKTKLELEKLNYEQKVRNLDESIKKLTKRNYQLQNIQLLYSGLAWLGGCLIGILCSDFFKKNICLLFPRICKLLIGEIDI